MKCNICGQKMIKDDCIYTCKYCQRISLVPHSQNMTNKGAFTLEKKKADKVVRRFNWSVRKALNNEI